MTPYLLSIYSTLSIGLNYPEPPSYTFCKLGQADSKTYQFVGKVTHSEFARYYFTVKWGGGLILVRPEFRLIRVEVHDYNRISGFALISLSRKPDDWNRAPIFKDLNDKDPSGEIEFGTLPVPAAECETVLKQIEDRKGLYKSVERYLNPQDCNFFWTSPTKIDQRKVAVIDLYNNIVLDLLPAINSLSWREFGFQNVVVQEERNLLGLYIGVVKAARTPIDEFFEAWMADDLLGLIDRKFAQFKDKGYYYNEWLPKNRDKLARNKSCFVCGTSAKVSRCAGCHKIYYCSAEHQKADWKNHKAFCKNEKQAPNIAPGANYNLKPPKEKK